ncbi:MAG: 50S ribosomal protein L9 [Candidatus Berkelbacteria bacterium]
MKVFLITDVKGLGRKGEIKDVNDGYARNFLFSKNLAVIPTNEQTKVIIEDQKATQLERKKERLALEKRMEELAGQEFVFKVKSDKNGHLYGSLGPKELAQKIGVNEKMLDVHIKQIGEHMVTVKFGSDLSTSVKIVVENEK